MSYAKYKTLAQAFIVQLDKSRVTTDPALCFTLGTDASLYRLMPQLIVVKLMVLPLSCLMVEH
ncbi:MAG: hypothetical protein GY829_01800 [Gammaproteobacteria bacterium]|nr:hypothetical protein [Gammaproteobacteria bacterium]